VGWAAWQHRGVRSQRFTATLRFGARGGVFVPVPFDPDGVWAVKPRHHVTGTVAGRGIRGVIGTVDGERGIRLGPAWLRGQPDLADGATVDVELLPEGPQRTDLADDLTAAFEANPGAGAFFDSLAQFYRRAYLRWIDGATRRPDERARRIAELITLLDAGTRQRPKP
jgi:hypothetical protein